jgi:hypothetical protein
MAHLNHNNAMERNNITSIKDWMIHHYESRDQSYMDKQTRASSILPFNKGRYGNYTIQSLLLCVSYLICYSFIQIHTCSCKAKWTTDITPTRVRNMFVILNIQHIKIFFINVVDLNVVSILNHVQICWMLIY